MNRAGGHLLSAQRLSSFLLCCYQPAFSSFLFHGLQFAQIAVFDITCKHKNKQVWEHAACGVQPWEDTGLRILRREEKTVSFCLCFSPEAPPLDCSLMTHWLKLGHMLLPTSATARAEPYHVPQGWSVRPPPLPCGHQGKSLWTRRTGWGLGGLPAALPICAVLAATEQRVGGCRPLESKPLSTLLPSDSGHTWFCLNLEPVRNHVLLGT